MRGLQETNSVVEMRKPNDMQKESKLQVDTKSDEEELVDQPKVKKEMDAVSQGPSTGSDVVERAEEALPRRPLWRRKM